MTDKLFLDDSSLRDAAATVVAVLPGGVVLDRTPFYARGGGQPGDTGALVWTGGTLAVTEAVKGEDGAILHPVAGEAPPARHGRVGGARLGAPAGAYADAHHAASAVAPCCRVRR